MIMGYVRLFVREVVSVLQGFFGALRRHWVRWDLRLAPRLRALAANLVHLRFSWVYDLELFSTQLSRQSCVALR
jgi:hypothetical protein